MEVTMPTLDPNVSHHPVVVTQFQKRAADVQLRIADQITAFAGSMNFVYLHVLGFAAWMLFVESSPWPTLTLIVSLEAIFLSTFVMIGQNRQAAFQQAKADHDFEASEQELDSNTDITRAIHQLTTDIHDHLIPNGARGAPDDDAASAARKPSNPQNNHSQKGT
jgi:uncharacterized membrane protein